MSKTSDRIRNTSRRIIDGDPLVWTDMKNFLKARVQRNVSKHSSKVKQITDETITTYRVGRYKAPKYGLSALIDPEYYGEQAETEFSSADEALEHYLKTGVVQGHLPHRLFDPEYYTHQLDKPLTGISAVEHFFETGGNAGLSPSPYFDSAFYLSRYDWTASQNPLAHYLCYGVKDGHDPFRLFDSNYYVRKAVGGDSTYRSPVEHYMAEGWRDAAGCHPLVDLEYLGAQIWPDKSSDEWPEDPLKLYLTDTSHKMLSPHPLFDPQYYFQCLHDLDSSLVGEGGVFDKKTRQTPLDYFLSPSSPRVNPSREFSVEQYKFQNPDLGPINGLYHYVRYGKDEGRVGLPSMRSALNSDLLMQLENEPTLLAPHQSMKDMFVAYMPREFEPGLDLLENLLDASEDFAPGIIYCLPQFFRGGAEKYGSKLVNTLAAELPDSNIMVIATDGMIEDSREWYEDAPNVKYLAFSKDDENGLLTNVLARFITLMRPKWVINNNSKICWQAYETFGRSMSINSKLAACLFCYDFDVNGSRVGYARDYIREVIPHLDSVLIDNKGFCKTLHKDFSLHPDKKKKLKYLYQPFEIKEEQSEIETRWPDLSKTVAKPRILWPSRFHKQKRPDLLREIAISMPEVDFFVWSPDSWSSKLAGGAMPSNVTFSKEEAQFSDIAQRDVSALLLCSAWEGLPTVLIESVEAGLPIVANDVGGVAEIVNDETGYLVSQHATIAEYVEAISALIANPEEATKRREQAFKNVKQQHSRDAYVARLKDIGLV